MKKTYINPKMTVTNVKLQKIINTSIQVGGSYNGSATIESNERNDESWDNGLW